MAEGGTQPSAAAPRTATHWGRFVAVALGTFVAALAALAAFLVLVDPYDTGRLTPFDTGGLPRTGQRLAVASVGRDPGFDSAIVGNSTSQLLSPERLGRLGAGRFVQLSIPGTGPVEQVEVLDWFRRRHEAVSALIVGIDWSWCHPAADLDRSAVQNPFPFWLVSPNDAEYVMALLSLKNIEAAGRRLAFKLRGEGNPHPADGYDDYEQGHAYEPGAVAERLAERARASQTSASAGGGEPASERAASAAFDRLGAALRRFPAATRKVLVFPPVHAASLPPPGSAPAQAWARCKDDAARLAGSVPATTVVDFLERAPLTEAPENWWDPIHYRRSIAEFIERRLAALLAPAS